MYKSGFAGEIPDSPMFPHIFDSEDSEDLKFVPKETDGDIKDVLRQPPIGIKKRSYCSINLTVKIYSAMPNSTFFMINKQKLKSTF